MHELLQSVDWKRIKMPSSFSGNRFSIVHSKKIFKILGCFFLRLCLRLVIYNLEGSYSMILWITLRSTWRWEKDMAHIVVMNCWKSSWESCIGVPFHFKSCNFKGVDRCIDWDLAVKNLLYFGLWKAGQIKTSLSALQSGRPESWGLPWLLGNG